jgi:hypothetical protein
MEGKMVNNVVYNPKFILPLVLGLGFLYIGSQYLETRALAAQEGNIKAQNDRPVEPAIENKTGSSTNLITAPTVEQDPLHVAWFSNESDNTSSIAWGDVDGDGDLDLAVGHADEQRRLVIYRKRLYFQYCLGGCGWGWRFGPGGGKRVLPAQPTVSQ